jgi:hypothetical protein
LGRPELGSISTAFEGSPVLKIVKSEELLGPSFVDRNTVGNLRGKIITAVVILRRAG